MFGGLAMFLFGMEVMGEGLKKSSGDTLRVLLQKLTRNTFTGLLTGMLVTAIIQASSATIVLTVGLLAAGILTLRQAISIVMGANIGTTITAQIIRLMDIESGGNIVLEFFKPSTLAPLALIIGIILVMFIKKSSVKGPGEICVGFGILFTGMMTMTNAVAPLAESETFVNLLTRFSEMPVLEIIVGMAVTVIVQSSSAVVGMLQALSVTGAMTFKLVYPLIMGINIGTCIVTAFLCSLGTSRDAKRTGIAHILFNVIGTILFMIVMGILEATGVVTELMAQTVDSGAIANFQSFFNIATAIVLLPFVNFLMELSIRIIPADAEEETKAAELAMLDEKLLVSPALAMAEAAGAIGRMGALASENMDVSLKQLHAYDPAVTSAINSREERIDRFADRADNFLIRLSHDLQSAGDDARMNLLMQAVPDFERIGDYATNIDELAERLNAQKVTLSDYAKGELTVIGEAVSEIVKLTVEAFTNDDNVQARRVEPLEEVIDDMVLQLRDNHTERLRRGICTVNGGLVFLETLTYLERAADQCSSIALLMLARENESIKKNHHAYLQSLHSDGGAEYEAAIAARRKQYLDRLSKTPQ